MDNAQKVLDVIKKTQKPISIRSIARKCWLHHQTVWNQITYLLRGWNIAVDENWWYEAINKNVKDNKTKYAHVAITRYKELLKIEKQYNKILESIK